MHHINLPWNSNRLKYIAPDVKQLMDKFAILEDEKKKKIKKWYSTTDCCFSDQRSILFSARWDVKMVGLPDDGPSGSTVTGCSMVTHPIKKTSSSFISSIWQTLVNQLPTDTMNYCLSSPKGTSFCVIYVVFVYVKLSSSRFKIEPRFLPNSPCTYNANRQYLNS